MWPAGHFPLPGINWLRTPSPIGDPLALAPIARRGLLASAQRLRLNEFLVRIGVLQATCHIKNEGGLLASAALGAICTMAGDTMVSAPAGLPKAVSTR